MTDDPLLPCPFCGSLAAWDYDGGDGFGWVECTGCRARSVRSDRDNAEASWNRRPTREETPTAELRMNTFGNHPNARLEQKWSVHHLQEGWSEWREIPCIEAKPEARGPL